MRFLVDAQLPPALARWVAAQGYPAEHVADLKMEAASDAAIWRLAKRQKAAILTKDEDFAEWRNTREGDMPRVVWIRLGNVSRQVLLSWFEALFPKIIQALEHGETLIEVR